MFLTLPVRDVAAATPRAAIVRLDLNGHSFDYRPGQAVLVGRTGQGLYRPYSLTTAPYEARQRSELEILVGLDVGGSMGAHLPDPAPGVRVDVEGPVGSFEFPEDPEEQSFLFVAGGTGIAPLRAMLHEALARKAGWRLAVVYSARAPDEFAYSEELQRLANEGAIALRQTVTRPERGTWTGTRGRITAGHVAELADTDTLCFVCGPHAFVEAMVPLLRHAAVLPERIRVEDWGA
jgi:ferredoxin-NADP reductase